MNAPTNETSLAPQSASHSALPEAWIDRLFGRFSAMYGSKFADLWRGCNLADVKALWADELGAMSRDELATGAAACKTRDWPPTLPEFLKLCRPPIDFESAYLEAVEQMRRRETGDDKWSQPAIYWAAVTIGSWDLRNATWGAIKHRWSRVFQEEVEKGRWPAIPEKSAALPAPGETSIDREEAMRRIEAVKQILSGKVAQA